MRTVRSVFAFLLLIGLLLAGCTAPLEPVPAPASTQADTPAPTTTPSPVAAYPNPGDSSQVGAYPVPASPTPVVITPEVVTSGGEGTAQPADGTQAAGDGGITLTLDNNGQTLVLQKGQRFLLKLDEAYDWQITIADPNRISRVKNVMVIKGAQGLYEALAVGKTELTAQGDPLCRSQKPACARPSLLFSQTITVQ